MTNNNNAFSKKAEQKQNNNKKAILESDYQLHKRINAIPFKIHLLANEYELVTFQNYKYIYRKFIEGYNNNKFKNTGIKIEYYPIPVGYELSYLGNKQVFLIDIKEKLPSNSKIGIFRIVGPAEINDDYSLKMSKDEEYVFENFLKGNTVETFPIYYSWGQNRNRIKNVFKVENKTFHSNFPNTMKKTFDVIFVNEFHIKKKYFKNNEEVSLPYRIKLVKQAFNLLKEGGSLWLEYVNISNKDTLALMDFINSHFKSVDFVRSKLYHNSLYGGFYVFKGYNSQENVNQKKSNIQSNSKSNSKSNFKSNMKEYIDEVQQQIYKKFNKFIERCEFINKRPKPTEYYISYQIDNGVEWCRHHKVEVSKYYKDKLYELPDITVLKRMFYPSETVNYKNLRLYYDTFYSITYYEEGVHLASLIKKYFPQISTIVDANANIGGSTITLAHYFPKIKAIEIDDERFKFLKHNVEQYKLNNVELINIDYNEYKRDANELVFFDPPWGGIFYKLEKNMELYLGETNIKKYLVKNTMIKVPYNFNMKGITSKFKVENLKGFRLLIFT